MDYIKEYRSFINSHYLSDGVRMTVAILLPSLIFGYYGLLLIGLAVSLGALCVSITDNPGPIHHRRNGLLTCLGVVFVVAIISGLAAHIFWLFGIVIVVFCFFFSMIGVYGARATSIGIAALLVMVLSTQHLYSGWEILYNALYLLAGGAWYMVLSLVLYSIRPYRLMQQALGEYVMAAADYLKVKASFYSNDIDYDKANHQLLNKQVLVQEKQALVADLLFKTRGLVKESTHVSRILMMIFLDVSDLFEVAMTSHQEYQKLHKYFDETGILVEYGQLITKLANELDEIGISVKSGRRSLYDPGLDEELRKERERLHALREQLLGPSNIEGFISLRHILDSIDNIAARIKTLHHYTTYDSKLRRKKLDTPDPEDFISHQEIDPAMLIDNLSFRSGIFRHSLRITLAALFAYLVAQFFPVGHSYWILLTVIVILKPAYSLTKQRNFERLAGTIVGVLLSALFLYLIKDKTVILVSMALCMIGTYSFIRKQYLVSVILMTFYLLLMFHLLDAADYKMILRDRIIDTFIGSAIAVLFSYLLAHTWEHEQIKELMKQVLKDNIQYYRSTAEVFMEEKSIATDEPVARRNSLVSLANLSDAFNRMLSEPKRKQKNILEVHQIVVSSHMLISHIATLGVYEKLAPQYRMNEYEPLSASIVAHLERAIGYIENRDAILVMPVEKDQVWSLNVKVDELMRARQNELQQGLIETGTRKTLSELKSIADQFYFIDKLSADIEKISGKMAAGK